MPALFRVRLTSADRQALTVLTRRGSASMHEVTRARVLLLADRATPDQQIAQAVALQPRTILRIRRSWAEGGLDAASHDRPRPRQELVDVHFPETEVIRLVIDNLNTHTPAAPYTTFRATEARRIARKLEWHYTPVHGNWLNVIEIAWSVLAQQCLKAWAARRNREGATVDWRFTMTTERAVLGHLHPAPDEWDDEPTDTERTAA